MSQKKHIKRKIVIYTHDTFGLGHIRRASKIAYEICNIDPEFSVLIISGTPCPPTMPLPYGTDYIKLPSLRSIRNFNKHIRYESASLNVNCKVTMSVRKGILISTLLNFQPDILLVDFSPIGVKGELLETLEALKGGTLTTKVVLGIRDIIDEPSTVVKKWKSKNYYTLISKYYDKIIVYGNKQLHDIGQLYEFPDSLESKTTYCGYIVKQQCSNKPNNFEERKNGKEIVVTVGGGRDGDQMLIHVLPALNRISQMAQIHCKVFLGPFSNTSFRQEARNLCPSKRVSFIDFSSDVELNIRQADLAICMAGYNTVCEILESNTPAVVIPRVSPEKEQLIRSQIFERLGILKHVSLETTDQQSLEQICLFLLRQGKYSKNTLSANRRKFIAENMGLRKVYEELVSLIEQ